MTEKERPLTSQPGHIQNVKSTPEDEISLIDLLEALYKKKVLIVVVTFICTLFSAFYAQQITPTYTASITFLPNHIEPSTSHLPNFSKKILPYDIGSTNTSVLMFSRFSSTLQSYSIQEKAFIDIKSDVETGKAVLGAINKSIQISNSGDGKKLEITGTKPELMSDFLNSLADAAKNEVVKNSKEIMQQKINALIETFNQELESLQSKAKAMRLKQITRLSQNLEIAKNMGVLENNFSSLAPMQPFIFTPQKFLQDDLLPLWYLYGQRAIEQELSMLKNQPLSDLQIEGAAELIFKIETLSKIDLSKFNYEPAIISQPSIPPTEANEPKGKIIAIGTGLGLFIGLLVSFLSALMVPLRERLKLSTHT